MIFYSVFISVLFVNVLSQNSCYFNRECDYQLYSSKTPYDAIRGDVRDYQDPPNCEAINIWSLHRHGNRNPGDRVTREIKVIAGLKDQIVAAHAAGRGELCAQDIEAFRKWSWNETLDSTPSFLTGVGYEELYDMGKRLRERYPGLMTGSREDYYFRPTNEQRTITSAMAFVHGLSEGTNLDVVIDDVRLVDDVIRGVYILKGLWAGGAVEISVDRVWKCILCAGTKMLHQKPYENCERYQESVKGSAELENAVNEFTSTADYTNVLNAVQSRLGITTQLSVADIYNFYEICRFDRSWTETKQSPWCAAFTNEDLVVLEYRDDVRHYYRNGYGSWVNTRLGAFPMQDLYENFQAAVQGGGKKVVSYFTHDTMMEMAFCALGMYKDPAPLAGGLRIAERLWRTSHIAALSNNLIAILYRCQVSGSQTYRFQILHNEKVSEICPAAGCTWDQFLQIFQPFANVTLDFCSQDYPEPEPEMVTDSAGVGKGSWMVMVNLLVFLLWRC